MLKKLLSYIFPVKIYQKKSFLSKNIEITYNNGKIVMDSENTNYSYGSLQKILRKGLRFVGFEIIKSMDHVLVLGVAGGSVIKTLVNEIGYDNKITGVDVDSEIIELANKFFELNKIKNLKIVIADAFEFILKTKIKYNLIIIDVFQDTEMPNFLFENFFMHRIVEILNLNGFVIFNTMLLKKEHHQRNKQFLLETNAIKGIRAVAMKRIANHNELIIISKEPFGQLS